MEFLASLPEPRHRWLWSGRCRCEMATLTVLVATLTGEEFAQTGGGPSVGLHLAAFAKCRGLQSGRAGELWWTRHAGELWWRLSQGGGAGRVVSLSTFKVSCQVLRKAWIMSCMFTCSWLPQRSLPMKGLLSWLGSLRWHGPSHCHSRKLPRNQVVVSWNSQNLSEF